MSVVSRNGIFDRYCFGPVDLLKIEKGSSIMRLQLRDQAGHLATATYEGCVYWRLDQEHLGCHISLVQQVTAEEMLCSDHSVMFQELKKNSEDVAGLLREWESEGLRFYLHYGPEPGAEYLVAAKKMTYREGS